MADPTPVYDTTHPVLVTGATGYVAGWLVRRLLEEGFTVHAAVRDPSNQVKIAHLEKMASALPGSIAFFKADLLDEGSYDAAMAGCSVVFHTASPFTSNFTDPQRDLVDPAVNGTRNVLGSASRTPSVSRVVVTSSCAAIYGDTVDVANASGGVLTESDWNTTSRLDHQAYSYSKVEAERAAWEMATRQEQWKLVVINPSLVVGPGTADKQTSESFVLARQFGDGTMKLGAPPLEIGMVDVRDVAEAHIRAGFIDGAQGRNIVSEQTYSFFEIGQILRAEFGDKYPFPTRILPKWLVWLVGPLLSKDINREMIAKTMGYAWRADHGKSVRELGMDYRPAGKAVEEMFRQMIDNGVFANRR